MELQYSRYYLVIWALLPRDSGPFVMRFSPYCAGGLPAAEISWRSS